MKHDQKTMTMEMRGDKEVVVSRWFAAPPQLVYDCHTKPELMRRWLIGPPGQTLEVCEVDLKVGGNYLYVYSDGKKNRIGVYGKFKEVIIPERLANTENYALDMSAFNPNGPEDPNAMVETRIFTAEGTGTRLTHICKYVSAEVCRATIESGAGPDGLAQCYEELDRLLASS